MKEFSMNGINMGIAQVNTVDVAGLLNKQADLERVMTVSYTHLSPSNDFKCSLHLESTTSNSIYFSSLLIRSEDVYKRQVSISLSFTPIESR